MKGQLYRLGPNHITVGDLKFNYAAALRDVERLKEAEKELAEAVRIRTYVSFEMRACSCLFLFILCRLCCGLAAL